MKYCKKHDYEFEKKCKVCNREYQREWFAKNKEVQLERVMRNTARQRKLLRDFVEDYLINNPCIDCGESNPIVLDFDHIDLEKKEYGVSVIVLKGMSLEKLKTEVAKCEIRCSNCHRKRTAKQFNSWRHQRFG